MGNLSRMIVRCGQRLMRKRTASSLICGRSLASKSSAPPARRNSSRPTSSQPCLVLPPNFARGQIEDDDDKDDEREKDKYFYCYYSLGEKKVMGVKDDNDEDEDDDRDDNSSSRKRVLLPWEKNMLLPEDAICVGSSRGWLAYVNTRQDCSLYLFKHPPLSFPDFFATGMFRLPPLQTHPRIPIVVTRRKTPDQQHPASGVTREYFCWDSHQMDCYSDTDDDPMPSARSPYFIAETLFTKLVLSSAPSPSPSLSFTPTPVVDTAGCIAMALIPDDILVFCKLGDQEWTPLKSSRPYYEDLTYSTKHACFLALLSDSSGHLDRIDFNDPYFSPSPKVYALQPSGAKQRNWERFDFEYLVESSGEILLIRGYICHENLEPDETDEYDFYDRVQVYKLDYVKQTWESVKCIGNHALFVGPNNHCFSLSTHDYPHVTPNSIYFIQTNRHWRSYYDPMNADSFRCQKILVYNIQDRTFEPFHTFDDKFIYPLPVWVGPCM